MTVLDRCRPGNPVDIVHWSVVRKRLGWSEKPAGPGEKAVEKCRVRFSQRMQLSNATIPENFWRQHAHRVLVIDHTMERYVLK